jgi:hypothetical protein
LAKTEVVALDDQGRKMLMPELLQKLQELNAKQLEKMSLYQQQELFIVCLLIHLSKQSQSSLENLIHLERMLCEHLMAYLRTFAEEAAPSIETDLVIK